MSTSLHDNVFGWQERLGLWLTARCPLRCPHCMFGTLLEQRDVPALSDVLDWIAQAAQLKRARLISLTGGEAFCEFEKLQAAVAYGAHLGLRMNVVTNAYWATSRDRARELLNALPALTDLCISVDEFHTARVPLEHVLNAAGVAHDLDRRVLLAVSHCRLEDFLRFKQELEPQLPAALPIVPVQIVRQGYAQRLAEDRFEWCSYVPRGMCSGVNVPMIDKHGVVYACCEPPIGLPLPDHALRLGNLREESLATILTRATHDPYLQALRALGPGFLAQLVVKRGLGHRLRRRYPKDSICEVCYDLLRDAEVQAVLQEEVARPEIQQQIAARSAFFYRQVERASTVPQRITA